MSPPLGSAWAEEKRPLQVVAQAVPKGEKKAWSCYGMLVRCPADPQWEEQMWVRFSQERPVSALTLQFLQWSCTKLESQGKRALLLIWDNAGWHLSHEVSNWIRAHNWSVCKRGQGVRILVCFLPSKSPWPSPIEPKWMHAKRAVAEPDGLIDFEEIERRVCARFACDPQPHLTLTEKVALSCTRAGACAETFSRGELRYGHLANRCFVSTALYCLTTKQEKYEHAKNSHTPHPIDRASATRWMQRCSISSRARSSTVPPVARSRVTLCPPAKVSQH